ncbi:MAG: pseudaminic acid synthase [Coriobacteriia bacterium]|nr:pseudaminic acid synthase [Coriobacteriia bacterium]
MTQDQNSVFVIAELSANHDGSLERARQTVKAAAAAGADAIKIQTYTADTLTLDCALPPFRIEEGLWAGRTLYELYQEAATPWEWHRELRDLAYKEGILFFSTPFDDTAVDFLEELEVPLYKIASFELIDIPLLKKVAATHKPVILSAGMATIAEVEEAVTTLREGGSGEVTLLKCTSAYPALPAEANLLTIPDMYERFACGVGLSDHTLGSAVAVAAVALGATVVEKHFTLDRSGGGPDDSFSMEPEEFAPMITDIRIAALARGKVQYEPTGSQSASLRFRRSLFVVQDISAGEMFTKENVRCIRPSDGLHPRYYEAVLGKCASCDVKRGTPLRMEQVDGLAC